MSGSWANLNHHERPEPSSWTAPWKHNALDRLVRVRSALHGKDPDAPVLHNLYHFNTLRLADTQLQAKGRKANGPNDRAFRIRSPQARHNQYRHIARKIRSRCYQPYPCRTVEIPKDTPVTTEVQPGSEAHAKSCRTLTIPAYADALILHLLATILGEVIDDRLGNSFFGFRPQRGIFDALANVMVMIEKGHTHVAVRDIRSAFDSIQHVHVVESLHRENINTDLIFMVESYLDSLHTDTGLPQGWAVSPPLLNLVLHHALDSQQGVQA